MGVFFCVALIFGTAGVLALAKLKKKEADLPSNKAELIALKHELHRGFKSNDIQATNIVYQTYLAELENAAANDSSYSTELTQIRMEYSFFKRKYKDTLLFEQD